MHAVVYERHGGPEVLEYTEVPDPSPASGQVLVDVEVAGVNFRDVYEREGREYVMQLPAMVGVEGAGTIVQTSQRVAWLGVRQRYVERVTGALEGVGRSERCGPYRMAADVRRLCTRATIEWRLFMTGLAGPTSTRD